MTTTPLVKMRTTKDDHFQKLYRSLFIVLRNREKTRSKLKFFHDALQDCDHALELDATHLKTLLCKGQILLYILLL
ncbi:hypothetical protein AAZV13_13G016100 [Glycine max]